MSDERLREAYERGLSGGENRPPLDDLAAERIRRLVEREGSEAERLHTLDQLLASAEGRRELEVVWAAARAARPRRSPAVRWLAAASALLVAGSLVTWFATREPEDVLRGETSPITLVAPVGRTPADRAERFVWRAVRGADRYVLVVVDTLGNEVFASETRDTSVTLPDSVRLVPGHAYLWWVQARTGPGASITAVTQRVVVE
jgi:hypothetical protein